MKVQTVNVVEIADMSVTQVVSFIDNAEGSQEAEQLFIAMAKENGMPDDETDEALENGFWNDGDAGSYDIYITHSS